MSSLKSIYEIVKGNYKFVIPAYQRGYRWTKREVEDLLEDILDFMRKTPLGEDAKSFYCLQPLVVKRDEEKSKKEGKNVYKVIDGQQRLTTILLILQALKNEIGVPLENVLGIQSFYEISYEIRQDSTNFLREIRLNKETEEKSLNNIDFWHMYNNYSVIVKWLKSERMVNELNACNFANTLLKSVGFIWYEVSEETDEIQIFTRLNMGKIPLTNSELIKALFLLPIKDENKEARLISEWDNIETKLQDNKFWGFIYGGDKDSYKRPTRIDILFELVAEDNHLEEVNRAKERLKYLRQDDERKSFYIFYEALRNKDDDSKIKIIEKLWDRTKYYFRILEEFYEDNELYHLIGYLVNIKDGVKLNKIIKAFQEKDRKDFKKFLKEEIKEKFKEKLKISGLEELSYSEDKEEIEKVLFLFNVVLTINANKNLEDEMYLRFLFHLHKSQKWNLEHINPRNPEDLNNKGEIRKLLEEYKNDKEIDEDLRQEIQEALNEDNESKLKEVIKKLFEKYSPNEEEKDSLGNLTLLSDELNKKIGNSFFYKKRKVIKEAEENGKYIPLGTKYVFMKHFTENPKSLIIWDKTDMEDYLKHIKKALEDFLKEGGDEEQ